MKQMLWRKGGILLCLLGLFALCALALPANAAVTQTRTEGIEAFPESYRPYLQTLQEAHPTWRFVAFDTGLTWDEVLDGETKVVSNNLVRLSTATSWKSLAAGSFDWETSTFAVFDGGRYNGASREIVAYYMDPRNSLDQLRYLFQFEQLTFDPNTQTEAGVKLILKGTFMKEDTLLPGFASIEEEGAMTYAQAFMAIAAELNVSPYHLAARVRQEQGTGGTSSLISGTYPGYEGYYNYFNVSASGSTTAAIIENGLKKAQKEGWDTAYKSLLGGSRLIADKYIAKGQDTLYLEKFDVAATGGLYSHQYMQNLTAAYSESVSVYNSYNNMGLLDGSFTFVIPIYRDMPETACPQPTADGNPNYKLQSLGVSDAVLDPEFHRDTLTYTAVVGNEVHTVKVSALAYAESAKIAGAGSIGLAVGENVIPITVTAERGDTCTYTLRVTRLADGEEIIAMGTIDAGVNLRTGPGTEHEILVTVPVGRTVSILAEENGWYRVIYGPYTGYVSKDYVTAYVPAKGLTLNTDKLTVTVGTPGTLQAITDPSPCDTPVFWKTSDAAVATVKDGVITGLTTGTATITAYTENGLSATCTVTVTEPVLFMGTVNTQSKSLNVRKTPSSGGTAVGKLPKGERVSVVEIGEDWYRILFEYEDESGKGYTAWVSAEYILSDPVPSTGVTLTPETGLLSPGETLQLGAAMTPVYANDALTWSSSASAVATVENGLVTAVSNGEAVITVTTASGHTATCIVTVKAGAESIVLDRVEAALIKGETLTLNATVLPEGAVDILHWSTDNQAVVTVENGVITAVGGGTATVTVATSSGKTATCTVTVTVPATGVVLDQTDVTLHVGATQQLTATLTPADSTDSLTWHSDNEAVVTVNRGVLTGVGVGTANVTVATASGFTASCKVTVIIPAESVTLDRQQLQLYRGESTRLTATMLPADTTDSLTWSSSNQKVVTVENGMITAVGAGEAVVTARADSGKQMTCTVVVENRILFTGKVNIKPDSTLNVRATPSSNGEKIGKLYRDDPVTVVEESEGWYCIVFGDGYGWVSGGYITRDSMIAESITLTPESITLDVGETADLSVVIRPAGHTDTLNWTTGDAAVVTVENGHLIAVGEGSAVVTVETSSGLRATCTVTVAHRYQSEVVEPGCLEDGFTRHTCTGCGYSYQDTFVSATGHQYSNETDWTCNNCGESRGLQGVYRIYGSNRFDTAFGAANMLKETLGVEKFENIIVACGTNFADALAGSYLGKVKNAPILLVQPNMVPAVRAYIEDNLQPGGTVYLLGGETIVPGGVSEGLTQFTTKRLWGANRYETNLAILEEAGVTGGEILVCTGYSFADSLSASAVGKPILLVDKKLTAGQEAYLSGLTDDSYVIVGGVGAVNEVVEESLRGYGAIERLAGANRFATSVMVAERFFEKPTNVVVAYAANFPDGLCGGPLAMSMGGPLLLTANNDAAITAAYTAENGICDGVVLGGPGLISDNAVRQIFGMEADQNIVTP